MKEKATITVAPAPSRQIEVDDTKYCGGCWELTNNIKRGKVVLKTSSALPLGPFERNLMSSVLLFFCLIPVLSVARDPGFYHSVGWFKIFWLLRADTADVLRKRVSDILRLGFYVFTWPAFKWCTCCCPALSTVQLSIPPCYSVRTVSASAVRRRQNNMPSRFTFRVSFVIEGFNASLAHVPGEPCWAVANVEAPLWEYIISELSYYSGTVSDF